MLQTQLVAFYNLTVYSLIICASPIPQPLSAVRSSQEVMKHCINNKTFELQSSPSSFKLPHKTSLPNVAPPFAETL